MIFPKYDMSEVIKRGTYCTDWPKERIDAARKSLHEYIAYCYWQDAGSPEGRDLEFWSLAEAYLNPPDIFQL